MFEDPHDVPERRYKLIGSDRSKWGVTSVNCGGARFRYFTGELETWEYQAVIGAHSPDGIHWTKYDGPIMPWYTDTHNVAFWDDRIERYVAYVRWNDHLHVNEEGRQVGSFDYRSIARSESDDFARFPEPVKVHEPDFSLPEDDDLAGGGLYNTAAIKYPHRRRRLPDLPLGLPPHQRHPRHPGGDEPRRHRLRSLARALRRAGSHGPLRLAVALHGARPRSRRGGALPLLRRATRTGTTSTSAPGIPGVSDASACASTASFPRTPAPGNRP